jgi:hypothetical protein
MGGLVGRLLNNDTHTLEQLVREISAVMEQGNLEVSQTRGERIRPRTWTRPHFEIGDLRLTGG